MELNAHIRADDWPVYVDAVEVLIFRPQVGLVQTQLSVTVWDQGTQRLRWSHGFDVPGWFVYRLDLDIPVELSGPNASFHLYWLEQYDSKDRAITSFSALRYITLLTRGDNVRLDAW